MWKETVLLPTLKGCSPQDIYNGDKTALFYKSLLHRSYCFKGRLTSLIITNIDVSDHRKSAAIGKSKTHYCLEKRYKMKVKDMAVDWYSSKNA